MNQSRVVCIVTFMLGIAMTRNGYHSESLSQGIHGAFGVTKALPWQKIIKFSLMKIKTEHKISRLLTPCPACILC